MSASTFVFEMGCEELPFSALPDLSHQVEILFAEQLKLSLLSFDGLNVIASPRRLGVIVKNIGEFSESRPFEKRGPAFASAMEDGKPTKALEGFCRGLGISTEDTTVIETEKGKWIGHVGIDPGKSAKEVLSEVCAKVVHSLTFKKVMRWGVSTTEFPRPVKWILAVLGHEVVPVYLFGLTAGRLSFGHRFHAPGPIELTEAQEYGEALHEAFVMPEFAVRKAATWKSILAAASANGICVEADDELLSEVVSLVEWPVALCCEFEERYLQVPEIALIAAMKGHQKYFHARDSAGSLSNRFITVSNIESTDPKQVIGGNQRVIRARLSDAEFFFELDCKRQLVDRRSELDAITFHPKLGSLGAKTVRLKNLVVELATDLKLNTKIVSRAAELCRCDLVTEMVLEFAELQGKMGAIYALLDGEERETALAVEGLYQPSGLNDLVPSTTLGHLLALADKMDTLAGLFAINQPPTGSKDPFALRRAAIGCIRLNEHPGLRIDLTPWIRRAASLQPCNGADQASIAVIQFIKDRERSRLCESGIRHDIVSAVQAVSGLSTYSAQLKAEALQNMSGGPDFDALVRLNKRVSNLLKEEYVGETGVDVALFESELEERLYHALEGVANDYEKAMLREAYEIAFNLLLTLKPYINDFFDGTMINVEDVEIKNNRLTLIAKVRKLFLQLADFDVIQS